MKKYVIKVNGTSYEVEVEEASSSPVSPANSAIASAPAPAPVPNPAPAAAAPAPATKPAAAVSSDEGSIKITCPMPGTILRIDISAGDPVKKGQNLVILEAMKMENEIVAPSDAKVVSVNVVKGASVNAGDILVTLN